MMTERQTETEGQTSQTEHNLGIDLLRLVSMGFVVLFHVFNVGGVLNTGGAYLSTPEAVPDYAMPWLVDIAGFCAVDCFVLVSGYVGYAAHFKWSRLVKYYLQTAFYSLLIALIVTRLVSNDYTPYRLFLFALPICNDSYWFMSSYLCMLMLAPALNLFLKKADARLIASVLTVCLGMASVQSILHIDARDLRAGLSVLWLCILYLLGGYANRTGFVRATRPRVGLLMYAVGVLVPWIVMLVLYQVLRFLAVDEVYSCALVSYLSPCMVLEAMGLLCFFANVRTGGALARLIRILSPATLGVYLIHFHPLLRDAFIANRFVGIRACGKLEIVVVSLAISFLVFMACILVELLRKQLFHWAGEDRLYRWVDHAAARLSERFGRLLAAYVARR